MVSPAEGRPGAPGRRPPRLARKLRLPLLLIVALVITAVAQELTVVLGGTGPLDLIVGVLAGALTLLGYVALSKRVEGRSSIAELPRARAGRDLLAGSAVGGGAFLLTLLIILVFGGWRMTGGGDFWKFLATIGIFACVAVTEEVAFRGVVFRIVEERLGTWLALVISAILFGLFHLLGTSEVGVGAMLWGVTAIILQGGLMLGAGYVATRTLWLPIGIHFAWNTFEAGFGTAVSGKTSEFGSLVRTTLLGPPSLTGGPFGPEAGAGAIVACVFTAACLLWWAHRNGRIVRRGGVQAQ